jgi:hypothetical protein
LPGAVRYFQRVADQNLPQAQATRFVLSRVVVSRLI